MVLKLITSNQFNCDLPVNPYSALATTLSALCRESSTARAAALPPGSSASAARVRERADTSAARMLGRMPCGVTSFQCFRLEARDGAEEG